MPRFTRITRSGDSRNGGGRIRVDLLPRGEATTGVTMRATRRRGRRVVSLDGVQPFPTVTTRRLTADRLFSTRTSRTDSQSPKPSYLVVARQRVASEWSAMDPVCIGARPPFSTRDPSAQTPRAIATCSQLRGNMTNRAAEMAHHRISPLHLHADFDPGRSNHSSSNHGISQIGVVGKPLSFLN